MYKFILFLLLLSSLHADLILTNDTNKYDDFKIGYFYDVNSSLSIEDINQTTFTQEIPNQFSLGYRDGTAWFKLKIQNRSNTKDFVLHFNEPFWSSLDLYEHKNGVWRVDKNALNIPMHQRSLKDNNPAYELKLNKNTTTTIYLKGITTAGHIGEFTLFTHDEFFRPNRFTKSTIYMFFIVILFTLIILNI